MGAVVLLAAGSAEATPLTVTARAELELDAESTSDGVSVHGRLADDRGRPAAGRLVLLEVTPGIDRPALRANAWTDADGSFSHRFATLPGTYTVRARFHGEALLEAARARAGVEHLRAPPRPADARIPARYYLIPLLLTLGLLAASWLAAHAVTALRRLLRARPVRPATRRAVRDAAPPATSAAARAAIDAREAIRRAWHGVASTRAGGPVWGVRTPAEVLLDHPDDPCLAELTGLCEEACFSQRSPGPSRVERARSLAARAARA